MNTPPLFEYIFIENNAKETIFLLHGTGGTKDDFLFLNDALKSKFNLVGLQGNILEQGNRRFFKRIAEGVFDQDNLAVESEKLTQFIQTWENEKKVAAESLHFLGYSNGANMILATLLTHPTVIASAVLLRPMLPFAIQGVDLTNKQLFIGIGNHDPMISELENQNLVSLLADTNARLTVNKYDTGHQLSSKEIQDVVQFLMQ